MEESNGEVEGSWQSPGWLEKITGKEMNPGKIRAGGREEEGGRRQRDSFLP